MASPPTILQQAQTLASGLQVISASVTKAQSQASKSNKPLVATLNTLATQVGQANSEASALVLNIGTPPPPPPPPPPSYPASVVTLNLQEVYDLVAGTNAPLTSTPTTVPGGLPFGWSVSGFNLYCYGNGSLSNCDSTGYTVWCSGDYTQSFTNVLMTEPTSNSNLVLSVGGGSTVYCTNCTIDGKLNTGTFYSAAAEMGSPGSVIWRYCEVQNVGLTPLEISALSDIQWCHFGPSGWLATSLSHTNAIHWLQTTGHIFSNNLLDYALPSQDGHTSVAYGPEGLLAQATFGDVSVLVENNIFRGIANYNANPGGGQINYTLGIGQSSPYTGSMTANNNAIESGVFGYYQTGGGASLVVSNNRDYDTDAVVPL
jgi:hypothetical protein